MIANMPPFARMACAPRMTLLTRDMIAYMDESGTKNVEIPAEDSARAISWPLYLQYEKRHEKLAKRNAWHRVRGARLRHDHVVRAEELRDARPEPRLRDDLVLFLRHGREELGHGDLLGVVVQRLEAGGEFGEEVLHANAMECGELDASVVGVQLRD